MPQRYGASGAKNLIAQRVKTLREARGWSQRDLARELQLNGMNMDKNIITRIETNKRYVTDIELRALAQVFAVSYARLIDGQE